MTKWIKCLNCGQNVFWVNFGDGNVRARATGYPNNGGEIQCTGCFEVGRAVLPGEPIPAPDFQVLPK